MNTKDNEEPQSERALHLVKLTDEFTTDIPFFAQYTFNSTLRPKQVEFVTAFANNRQITFRGGVGFGKTHAMAIVVWWALICFHEVQVTIFGPNEGQIKSGIWKELQILHNRMDEDFKEAFDVTATRIQRKTRSADCFAEFRLANKDNISSTRGIHQKNNFVLVDEATGVDEEIFTDSLINILTDPNPKLCLISNPSSTTGYFYRTWNDDAISGQWAKVHGKMADNPLVTPELIENMAGQYGGKLSRQYRIMVEGEFPLDEVDGLIARHLVEEAVANTTVVPALSAPIIWGVDPAGAGGDRSVLIKRHDNKVIETPKEWRGLDPTQLTYKIRDEYQNTPQSQRPTIVCVDAIGIGNGVASNLRDMGLPIKAVVVSNSPTRKPEFYSRLRDQLWWECREWFQTENVSIPDHPDLIAELCTPTYDDSGGKIKVEDKKSLRKRMRASPDFADALCLTFAVSATRYASKYSWSKPFDTGNMRWAE